MKYRYDISVIIPTYNQEQFVQDTIESVINQNFSGSYEILISDDGSVDQTWKIVEQYGHLDNVKINRFEENTAYVENYNWLIRNARGKYIAHLDGDDLYYPSKLQKAFDCLEADSNCNCVFHRMDIEFSDGRVYHNFVNYNLSNKQFDRSFFILHRAPFGNSSKVFRSENAVLLDGDLTNWKVFDYWLHLQHLADGYARVCDDEVQGLYRMYGATAGKLYDEKLLRTYAYYLRQEKNYQREINASLGFAMFRKLMKFRSLDGEELLLFFDTSKYFSIKKYIEIVFLTWKMRLHRK